MFQHCLLVDVTSPFGTTSNQHWNNVVYFKVGSYNVKQRQSTLCILRLTWTMLSFSPSSFTTLVNVEAMLRKWTFQERTKNKVFQLEYTKFKVLNYYFIIFTFLLMLKRICRRVLAKSQMFSKDYEKYCTART